MHPSLEDRDVKLVFSAMVSTIPFKPDFDYYRKLLRVVTRYWERLQLDIFDGLEDAEKDDFACIDHVIQYIESDEKIDEGRKISSKFHTFFSFLKGELKQDVRLLS
jgi:hypothetical protein